jgi:acyl-CoA thioesterase FadM
VRPTLARLSRRSFRIEYDLLDEQGTHLARVALVHAGMDTATGQGADVSDALCSALVALPRAEGAEVHEH